MQPGRRGLSWQSRQDWGIRRAALGLFKGQVCQICRLGRLVVASAYTPPSALADWHAVSFAGFARGVDLQQFCMIRAQPLNPQGFTPWHPKKPNDFSGTMTKEQLQNCLYSVGLRPTRDQLALVWRSTGGEGRGKITQQDFVRPRLNHRRRASIGRLVLCTYCANTKSQEPAR